MGVEDDAKQTVEEILKTSRIFKNAKRNIVLALGRVEFEQAKQKEGEDFEDYYASVQQIAEDADLCSKHCQDCAKTCWDMRLSTQIMSGIRDQETKTKLLAIKEEEFKLDKVVDICRTGEAARKNEKNYHRNMCIN